MSDGHTESMKGFKENYNLYPTYYPTSTMTRDEFIGYVRAIIDQEKLQARQRLIKSSIWGDIELVGALSLIEQALNKLDNSHNQQH